MKRAAYIITWAAIAAVFGLGIYAMGENVSLQGLGFLFVVVIPYLGGMWALLNMHFPLSEKILSWTLILLSIVGVYLICDALFIHPDPQSSWIFIALPVFLFPIVMIAGVVAYVIQRKRMQ